MHQWQLSKWQSFSVQLVSLYWSAVLWSMCFAQNTCCHSLKTDCHAMTIALDTNVEYSSKENWMMNTVVCEQNNFINISPSKLCRRKKTKILDIIFLILLRVQRYFKHWVKEQYLSWWSAEFHICPMRIGAGQSCEMKWLLSWRK